MQILPTGRAFSHALTSTLKNLPFAFHASWPWMLLLLPLQAFSSFYIASNFPNFDPRTADEATRLSVLAATLPMNLASLLISSSIAVTWHRYILLDEIPQGWSRLRLDGTVLRYFGNILLLSLIIGLSAAIPAVLISVLAGLLHPVFFILAIPLLAVVLIASTRMSVKLPAVALERTDFGFKDALAATRGSDLPILGFVLLVVLMAFGLAFGTAIISMPFARLGNDFGFLVVLAVQFVVNWVMTIFSVTMLTSLYGFFVEERSF
jgi:hypothetical protein